LVAKLLAVRLVRGGAGHDVDHHVELGAVLQVCEIGQCAALLPGGLAKGNCRVLGSLQLGIIRPDQLPASESSSWCRKPKRRTCSRYRSPSVFLCVIQDVNAVSS
jgi:hypothetical protein